MSEKYIDPEKNNGSGELPEVDSMKHADLEQTISYAPGESAPVDDARNGQFHRSFSKRQIHVRTLY